jgi:hypothetical protein
VLDLVRHDGGKQLQINGLAVVGAVGLTPKKALLEATAPESLL